MGRGESKSQRLCKNSVLLYRMCSLLQNIECVLLYRTKRTPWRGWECPSPRYYIKNLFSYINVFSYTEHSGLYGGAGSVQVPDII